MSRDNSRERMEAIQAGEYARECLIKALAMLNNAKGWGIYDLFGGGFISTIIKHSRMKKASSQIEEARTALARFSRELGDIREYADADLSTEDFWGFADWFFDDLLSDWIMQNRINEALDQVQHAISKINTILNRLK